MKRMFVFILLIVFLAAAGVFSQQDRYLARYDFKKFYEVYNVNGSFAIYDLKKATYTLYNKNQFDSSYTPASTFKICNSLIALETGVIKNENIVLKWDGKPRTNPEWNKDQDMKTAFKNSTVWYYQELARKIGSKRMKMWLQKADYGNADISGGIDKFWLNGGLRISPRQQIDFLVRLYKGELPFSKKTMEAVKKIMITEEGPDYVMRAKTGWGEQDGNDIGWYVGYITSGNNVYFFSNCIQSRKDNPDFSKARIEIVRKIFDEMKLRK